MWLSDEKAGLGYANSFHASRLFDPMSPSTACATALMIVGPGNSEFTTITVLLVLSAYAILFSCDEKLLISVCSRRFACRP